MVNKSFGKNLRSLVVEHPKQWDRVLAQVEFAYNDSELKHKYESISYFAWNASYRGLWVEIFGEIRIEEC